MRRDKQVKEIAPDVMFELLLLTDGDWNVLV